MSADIWWPLVLSAALVVVACLAVAIVNARHNERIDREGDMLLLRETDLDWTDLGQADTGGPPDSVVASPSGVQGTVGGASGGTETELDEAWADQLAAMNAEHLLAPAQSDEARVMQAGWFDAWEADQAAWAQAWRDAGDDTDMWLAHGMAGVEGEWPPYTMAAQIHTERMVTA